MLINSGTNKYKLLIHPKVNINQIHLQDIGNYCKLLKISNNKSPK